MTYRPDIEGLRAVAVILVVAGHAKVAGLAGGFVGVDVFFVLSGYLITGLLVEEWSARGRVDLAAFYARRFRRLFPSLAVVLAVTALLGQQLLPVGQQPEQAKAAASAAVWLSNFFFGFSYYPYFGPAAEDNLFLHTWSLGVEEQFYLAWPALLWLLMRRGAAAGRARLRVAMPIVALLGFIGCVAWTATQPVLAFYMMPARAWQFALGAMVFLLVDPASTRAAVKLRWAGWLGLGAIAAAALVLDGAKAYPGAWASLPSVGAAAVLASGVHGARQGVGRLLSLRPMQAIGRVSYVWYLWHWPALLIGAAVLDLGRPEFRAALALLSLALAWATHRFIEAPARDAARFPVRPSRLLPAALAMMILGNALALRWSQHARDEKENFANQVYERARIDAPSIYAMDCDDVYRSDAVRVCEFGTGKGGKTAVVLGDSIALQWFPALDAALVSRGWQLLVITKSSCPMVDEPVFYAAIRRRYEVCERWRSSVLQVVSEIHPDLIVMGSADTYALDERQWVEGTRRVLAKVAGSARRVYVLRATPALPFDAPSCLEPRGWLYDRLAGDQRCTAPVNAGRRDDVHRWQQRAAAPFGNVGFLDMTEAVCPGGVCRAQRGGKIVFRDYQHLTASFARSLGEDLARRLRLDAPAGG